MAFIYILQDKLSFFFFYILIKPGIFRKTILVQLFYFFRHFHLVLFSTLNKYWFERSRKTPIKNYP